MSQSPAPAERFDAENQAVPLWLRSIHAALPMASQFVVHGGIRDRHLVSTPTGEVEFHTTAKAIWEVLEANGFDCLVTFSPLEGVTIAHRRDGWQPPGGFTRALSLDGADPVPPADFHGLDGVIDYLQTTGEAKAALLVDYVSQAAGLELEAPSRLSLAMLAALRNAHRTADVQFLHQERGCVLRHPVFWLVDQPNDLPPWMLSGDTIRQVVIGRPELPTRAAVASLLIPAAVAPGAAARFADATEGLSINAMIDAASFVHASRDLSDVDGAVRAYRVGVSENPWRNRQLREKLQDGRALLEARVKGQPRAVQRVLDLLIRSAMGLTSAHQRRPGTSVRGVLYFSGATGVGKTEMAKAIAELVFGKEEALIRFDMSEFAGKGSDLRLIGSPPGYIGHTSGGELTNAVRRRPFSVVLFDEIDKAHGSILDKFLQILSDGRLTDGSGDTVYFTDTIIIFTSNQGVLDTEGINTDTEDGLREYERTVRVAVEGFFTDRLNRPELLGRIGDNIVTFRPITPAVGRELAEEFLTTIVARVASSTGIAVELAPQAREALLDAAVADLSKGGRGIGLALESVFVNPLARELFPFTAGSRVVVESIGEAADGTPTVRIRACN